MTQQTEYSWDNQQKIGTATYKGIPNDFYKIFWNITPFTKGKVYDVTEFEGILGVTGDDGVAIKFVASSFTKIKKT